jgi:hypothetical protein
MNGSMASSQGLNLQRCLPYILILKCFSCQPCEKPLRSSEETGRCWHARLPAAARICAQVLTAQLAHRDRLPRRNILFPAAMEYTETLLAGPTNTTVES